MRLLVPALRTAALIGGAAAVGATAAALPASAVAGTAPVVRITEPQGALPLVSGGVELRAVAQSASGIRRVEFRLDGRRLWTQRSAPWRVGGKGGMWNTRAAKSGVRRVSVLAIDATGGRSSASKRVKVVRAGARPYVEFAAPRAGARVSGGVRIEAKVAADAGVGRVEFLIDGVRRWTQRSGPWRFGGAKGVWNTARYPVGKRTLTVRAYDKKGRKTTVSRPVRVVRGPAAPTPPPATPAPGTTPGSGVGIGPRTPPARPLPPATRFVSTGGSDSGSCIVSAPCRSFGRAYDVSSPGEVVEIAGGSHGSQSIIGGSGKSADNPVTLRPAPGAAVSLSYLRIEGAVGLEIRDVSTDGWVVQKESFGVTLRGVRSTDGAFISSSHRVSIVGGEIGPIDSIDGIQIKRSTGGTNPTDLVFDGISIHDITRNSDPDTHTDCMQFGAGDRVAIRNSFFNNCGTQGVFTREFSGGDIREWVVENNVFGRANEGYYSLIIHNELSADKKFLVRYNSSTQAWRLEAHGLTVIGNVAPKSSNSCESPIVYRYNVWSEAKCHSTDIAASPGFLNGGALDLRLAPGSAAINRGDPSNYPAADYLGTVRPLGGRPDAGAFERQ